MPIEIACGNCGDSFGVEAQWAGLVVECPFCQTAVQVPEEIAQLAEVAVETEAPDFQEILPGSEQPEPVSSKISAAETSSPKTRQTKTRQSKSRLSPQASPQANPSPHATTQARTPVPLPSVTTPPPLPIPPLTTPPTVAWLSEPGDGNLGLVRVVVKVGTTTTIQYQGERVVLRDQPTVRQWYGTVMFFLSVITLALILTGLYFVYRV